MKRRSLLSTAIISILFLYVATQSMCGAQTSSFSSNPPLWAQMQEAILQKHDSKEVLRILEAGFDVNSPIGCGTYSALDGAVQVQNMEMLKILLQAGARPKGSALLAAAFCQNADISLAMVEALVKAGADPNYKEDYPNPDFHSSVPLSTPLHKACYRGHLEVVRFLVGQPGIELNTLDVDGETPLMCAVRRGRETIVRLLLEKGADPKVKNPGGKTALDIALQQNIKREDILKILSDAKATSTSK